MNSLPDLPHPDITDQDGGASACERIEDCLDHLCAPLVGIVPYRERQSFRWEVRLHLEGLVEEYREQTDSPEAAVEAALREFGEPWQTGEAFVRNWSSDLSARRVNRRSKAPFAHAFAWFCPPTVLCLLLIEQYSLVSEQEWLLAMLSALVIVAPVLAGFLTGATTRGKIGREIVCVVSLLALFSLLTGTLLLPKMAGVLFGLFQLIYWLPTGWLSAAATVALLRQHRRQRFLHPARR
jgi:hypothetical protein